MDSSLESQVELTDQKLTNLRRASSRTYRFEFSNKMSQALIWSITKDNHCHFLKSRKNGGVQFDKNPNNLKNRNTLKYSLNNKSVGVQAGPNNKGVVMTLGGKRKITWGAHKGQRSIVVKSSNVVGRYNPALRGAARKRVSAILRSQN